MSSNSSSLKLKKKKPGSLRSSNSSLLMTMEILWLQSRDYSRSMMPSKQTLLSIENELLTSSLQEIS